MENKSRLGKDTKRLITFLKKSDVKQRYCPLCLKDDVKIKHDLRELDCYLDDRVFYLSPTVVCSDCGENAAFEWAEHSCEVHAYAEKKING